MHTPHAERLLICSERYSVKRYAAARSRECASARAATPMLMPLRVIDAIIISMLIFRFTMPHTTMPA